MRSRQYACQRIQLEIEKENSIGLSWAELAAQRAKNLVFACRPGAQRDAASLFADFEVLQSRVRPYAPLDVHIPEWLEPELVALIGTGITTEVLDRRWRTERFSSMTVTIRAIKRNFVSK